MNFASATINLAHHEEVNGGNNFTMRLGKFQTASCLETMVLHPVVSFETWKPSTAI
jgi:hypothetical protein